MNITFEMSVAVPLMVSRLLKTLPSLEFRGTRDEMAIVSFDIISSVIASMKFFFLSRFYIVVYLIALLCCVALHDPGKTLSWNG